MLLAAHVPANSHDFAFEIKWDGIRAISFADGKTFRILSRNALDATFRYPELAELGEALGHRTAILDGEIIALDPEGNPSFPLLQQRMNVTRPDAVAQAARLIEVRYVLFDVLFLDGRDLRAAPWRERRERLESLAPSLPPAVKLSPAAWDRVRKCSQRPPKKASKASSQNAPTAPMSPANVQAPG